jgi:pimeloyl-ACP methyl ester carboxylesterase
MISLFDEPRFNAALFFPRAEVHAAPARAVDEFVAAEPGVRLHLRLHAAPAPLRVLLFHGNGEVVADYDELAAEYARCGAALAICDYRGYGASTGVPTLRSALSDAHLLLAATQRLDARPLVIMGRSLGGACAAELMRALRDRADPQVRGFVLESSGSDLAALVLRRGMQVREFSADERAVFDPLPKLAACTHPALVLHGANDTLIRFAEAELSACTLRAARLVAIPDRGHNDLSCSPLYWSALAEFFARVVASA